MGLGPAEEARGRGEGVLYGGLWDRVVREVDEAGGLEAVEEGLGGVEAFGGAAVEEGGEVDELGEVSGCKLTLGHVLGKGYTGMKEVFPLMALG